MKPLLFLVVALCLASAPLSCIAPTPKPTPPPTDKEDDRQLAPISPGAPVTVPGPPAPAAPSPR